MHAGFVVAAMALVLGIVTLTPLVESHASGTQVGRAMGGFVLVAVGFGAAFGVAQRAREARLVAEAPIRDDNESGAGACAAVRRWRRHPLAELVLTIGIGSAAVSRRSPWWRIDSATPWS